MKIWGNISKITGSYNGPKNVNRAQKPGRVGAKKDVVSISDTAKDMKVVKDALGKVPDIRKEKVDLLMQRYRAGQYKPSGKEIAEKIVNSVFDKKA